MFTREDTADIPEPEIGGCVECIAERGLDKEAIGGLEAWADRCQMDFNDSKCHILHIGRNNQQYSYFMGVWSLRVWTMRRMLESKSTTL